MIRLAAQKLCVEEGAAPGEILDWGEAGVRGWGGDDDDDVWGRRLQQVTPSVCTLAPTKAPTKAPTPSPTSRPTAAPTGGVCRTSTEAALGGGANGRGKACVFPFTYKG